MRLYSKEEWSLIPWPDTEEGTRLRALFEPMFKEGVNSFISNVETQVYILQIEDLFIPLTVNDKEYRNSYVCSIYSLLLYAEEELKRHHKNFLKLFLTPVLLLLKLWFRLSKINQLVIVNNFLFSTTLYPSLSFSQIQLIHQFIKDRFPNHAILFRSLNTFTEKNLSCDLRKIGCDLITSRSIYFFDPQNYPNLPSKIRWAVQKDIILRNQEKMTILQHEEFRVSDAPEIKRLYDLLYLEKYSYFNPAFTTRFFEQTIQEKTLTLLGIRYEGRLVGFIGFFKTKGIMTAPMMGYDTKLPLSLGLYRLLTIQLIEESLSSNTIFHMSAGVGHFKRRRGAFQEIEAMAVFSNHLPCYRRFFWKSLGLLFNKIGAPILKKHKL